MFFCRQLNSIQLLSVSTNLRYNTVQESYMHTVKPTIPSSIRVLIALTALVIFSVSASDHNHEQKHDNHHKASHEILQLDHGKKWLIDASLHTGMTRIKTSIEKNIAKIHHGEFEDKQYMVLAEEVNTHLAYLFEHCKLPSDADAQLHIFLANIMQGAEQMKSDDKQRQGAIKIIQALQTYPTYFNDVDWLTLDH